MGLVSKPYTFSAGAVIIASEHNSDFDTIYNCINGNISNANISNSAAIAYSKLALTGAILNADLAGSIADSKLSQITTASKVHGSSITGLTSVPVGAGVLPIANIASGTPNGTKFVRDDGTLAKPLIDYAVGDYLLTGTQADSEETTSINADTKLKEFIIVRDGTLRIKFDMKVDGDQGRGRIYKNGVAVGSEQLTSSTSYATYSQDISGWSRGDLVQLYARNDSGAANLTYMKNFRLYADCPSIETATNA